MARFPFMDQYFSVFSLISHLFCESAMIFVGMGQNDPMDIREFYAAVCKFGPQRIRCLTRLWPNVDQRQRVFLYQIDVDVTDIEGRRYGDRNNVHKLKLCAELQNYYTAVCIKLFFELKSS